MKVKVKKPSKHIIAAMLHDLKVKTEENGVF